MEKSNFVGMAGWLAGWLGWLAGGLEIAGWLAGYSPAIKAFTRHAFKVMHVHCVRFQHYMGSENKLRATE